MRECYLDSSSSRFLLQNSLDLRARIQKIIESFFAQHGKRRAVFLLEKNTLFSFSHYSLYEGPNDRVAYNIFNDTRFGQTLSEILVYISMDEEVDISEHLDFLKALYYANGYELETFSQIPLKPYDSVKTTDTNEQILSWLEKNAPSEVFLKMRESISELSNGNNEARAQ